MRKKTLEERIADELKYSEVINKKIKKIEKKVIEKKQKSKSNKNNFEFVKEYNYLREQQKKIENELMVQLYDITPSIQGGDDLMKEYYNVMNIEKDINVEFNEILSFVKTTVMVEKGVDKNGKVEKNGIDSLMKTLHDFLKNIISVNQEDLDILIDINDKNDIDDISNSDQISLLFDNDVFNVFGINDVDYVIKQELNQAKQNSTLIFPSKCPIEFKLTKTQKNRIKENYFSFPFISFKINQQLYDRAHIALGEMRAKEKTTQIEKTFALVNLKYKKDYDEMNKKLLNALVDITKSNINLKIKTKCSNMTFFIKNFNNSKSLTQRLSDYNINSRQVVNQYTSFKAFIEFLFSHKNNFKILISNYSNEINELKNSTMKTLQEEISNAIQERKENIEKFDFNQRKQEMNVIHQKNKEIFEIKQKIKNEKKMFEEKLNEKINKEKELKQQKRNEMNKIKTEHYKEMKKEEERKQQEKIKKEMEQLRLKQKEEIEQKLPSIIQRHVNSTNLFIQNQMYKEMLKEQKEYNEQRLNYIIENYKTRPQVEADPQRLVSITQNLQNRFDNIQNGIPDQDEKAKMFTNNGFTVEHLMKDFRYKVSSVLYEAGIIDKQYSKDLLRNLAFAGANANMNLQSNLNI